MGDYGELDNAIDIEVYKAFGKEQMYRKYQGKSERTFKDFSDKIKTPWGKDNFKKMTAKHKGPNDRIKKSEERQNKLALIAGITLKGNFEQRRSGLFSSLSQPDLRCSKLPFKVIPSIKASLFCLSSDFLILSLEPLYLAVIFLKLSFSHGVFILSEKSLNVLSLLPWYLRYICSFPKALYTSIYQSHYLAPHNHRFGHGLQHNFQHRCQSRNCQFLPSQDHFLLHYSPSLHYFQT